MVLVSVLVLVSALLVSVSVSVSNLLVSTTTLPISLSRNMCHIVTSEKTLLHYR